MKQLPRRISSKQTGEGITMKLSRTNLVHITTVPESLGFFKGQTGYMKAKGFEVHALTSPSDLLDAFARSEDIPVHSVEMARRITPIRDLVAITRLRRWLRQIRPHIVHAHTPKGGLLGMIAAWSARVPVRIYHIHGLPLMTARGHKRILLRWSEQLACRLAHQVLCVSHSVREVAVAEGLCPAGKIKVLLNGSINGVDANGRFNPLTRNANERAETRQKYEIPADALVVGFIGRIVRDKGIVELFEAWKILRQEQPSVHLLLAGPFEAQDPLPTDVVEQLQHDPRVHLTSWVHDTAPLYAAIDVLALPTYREGLPLTPLEAASMMVPVVATQVPGCVEAVEDGTTGMLVRPRNAEALADALRIYLNDAKLRKLHGWAGRERVLRMFRQDVIWDATYNEYMRLLQEKGQTLPLARACGDDHFNGHRQTQKSFEVVDTLESR